MASMLLWTPPSSFCSHVTFWVDDLSLSYPLGLFVGDGMACSSWLSMTMEAFLFCFGGFALFFLRKGKLSPKGIGFVTEGLLFTGSSQLSYSLFWLLTHLEMQKELPALLKPVAQEGHNWMF